MSTINEQLEQERRNTNGPSTTYFSFKVGENRLRILTEGQPLSTHFFTGQGTIPPKNLPNGMKASACYGWEKGCPFHGENAPKDEKGNEKKASTKYTCYVIDKNDQTNRIRLADIPYSAIKQIGDLQNNIDYKFTFPMPYDVTITYNDKAIPMEKYKVIPSPKFEFVTDDVMASLAEEMGMITPTNHVANKKTYEIANHKKLGIWISPEKAAEAKKNWRANANKENATKIASGEVKASDSLEYPEEKINSDDIPF